VFVTVSSYSDFNLEQIQRFMLKKISVQQLTTGMYLKEFCGSWMEHPFWRTSFVLKDPKDVQAVMASNIKEVWIDVSKGIDAAPGTVAVTQEQVEATIQKELTEANQTLSEPVLPKHIEPVPIHVEFSRANDICQASRKAVISMFQEARMGNAINAQGAQKMVDEISESVARNTSALISLARLKTADDYTYMHSVAVCAMMIALSRQLGLSETQTRSAGLAGLLHDLGKAVMPPGILNKPGKLTDEEFAIMRAHPVEGHKMLKMVGDMDPMAMDVCLHHHEKVDGSGYPKGLKDKEITLFAKMGAVCDVYDAITSNRPYKAGWDPAESLRKMAEWCEGHFDRAVFQAFVKSLGIYPIGSLVRLASGKIAVVIEQTNKSLITPRVKAFYSVKSELRITPEIVDLSSANANDKIVGREDPSQWNFPDLNELWSGLNTHPT
jgi:HD-GYP domain-containing protein (c-di-GMP phosphodiesterase class II)